MPHGQRFFDRNIIKKKVIVPGPMMLTSKDLDNLKNSIPKQKIIENNAYYRGKNPPILTEQNKRKPDNKIPVALGFRLISNLSGYAARTGDIFINQVPEQGEDTDDSDFEKLRQQIDKANKGFLLNSQLYIETLKQGISYDVVWTVKDDLKQELLIKYAQIPTIQAVPIWSKELETVKTLKFFVRFWNETLIAGTTEALTLLEISNITDGQEIKIWHAQVFQIGGYQLWIKINNEDWKLDGGFVEQPFNTVQVSAYRASQDAISYIDPVTILLDQMDKLISRNMNEVERFNNSLLGVLKKIDPKTKSKIDQMGLIDNLIEGLAEGGRDVFPRFITREIPSEHAKMMLDSIGKLIYEIMGSPNFTAESFGTASGIALMFRLIGLEYSASEIDIWYDQGLMNRDDLINQALDFKENETEINKGFMPVIVHNRNLPVDLSFLVDNALKLKALGISIDTILKMFPKSIIADVKAEIERIEKERKNNLIPPLPDEDDNE